MVALGIGASVAIVAFVDAALIKPLPYHNPSRLLFVTETTPEIPRARLSYLSYASWQKRFARKPDIIGQSLVLNEIPHTIVGVREQTAQTGLDLRR
jgi:hypothetical protein